MTEMSDTELTRLAAERVMGWSFDDTLSKKWIDRGFPIKDDDWCPLTDWSAAGEIVEKMRADGWYLQTDIGPTSRARATFHLGNAVRTGRDKDGDMLRAITLAALFAVGALSAERPPGPPDPPRPPNDFPVA